MMAVHTRIRATGLSLVCSGMSLMSGGGKSARENVINMRGGEFNLQFPPSRRGARRRVTRPPVVCRPRGW
jgi:hypothetical protein